MKNLMEYLKKVISYLAATAMAGIVILVFANVVMRYTMNSGLTWSDEVAVNLFVWFIFLGAILAAMEGMHLKVDVLTSKLPPGLQKVFSFVANLFVLAAMGILIIGGYKLVLVTNNNMSSATGLPYSCITVSLVIFAVCVTALTLYQMAEDLGLRKAGGGDQK